MTPQLVDTGRVYSIKPEDRKGDFTFTRSSAATRVNASGNIEKETQNLLLQSNQFDTTWTTPSSNVTSGQSGYDGSSDAWSLNTGGVGGYVIQSLSYSGLQTLSVYAKAGSYNFIRVQLISSGPDRRIDVNLMDGSTGTAGGGNITASTTSIGGGWWRIQLVSNATSSGARFYAIVADGDLSGSSGNIYIQDAQLEQGLVARDYIETTTAAVEGGITDNVPRLDYTDSSCPALLLEPLRTNLLYHSEYFSSGPGGWQPYGGAVLTYNNAISLEGITNAMKMTSGGLFATFPTAANTDYVFSVFAKTDTATSIALNYTDQSGPFRGGGITYTFATNSVAVTSQSENNSVSADREDYGNGWIRVMIKFKTNVAKSYNYQQISFAGGDGWIYGAQYEAGSYATSYIPTYGSSVTRVDETNSLTGVSDLIGQTEGVIYWEGSIPTADQNTNVCQFNNSTTSSVVLEKRSNGKIRARIWNSGSPVVSIQSNSYGDENLKIAFAYKSGDVALYINGAQILETNTTEFTFAQLLSGFQLGVGVLFFAYPNTSKPKQSMLFKTRLSNEELAALTTI